MQMDLPFTAEPEGEAPRHGRQGTETPTAKHDPERPTSTAQLMEEICDAGNLKKALKRVKANKGAAGVDQMTVEQLPDHLRAHWPEIKAQLLEGSYRPKPVRRVEIEKPTGGVRKLGIPCVVDRFIQQAVMQVLQGQWDPTFSEHSYGFRPGRSAQQAVSKAQAYVAEGHEIVVDLDLEKFFDRVNHDILMSRVARRVDDKRVLTLIRAFLEAGVMEGGLVSPSEEGTPQGGPLSPLLSNLLLDEFDKELEARGLRFARYADDCNVYVRSQRAGERVKASLTRYLARRLRLTVNETKSAVAKAGERQFLGFRLGKTAKGVRRFVAPKAVRRFKNRVRELTGRSRGVGMERMIRELATYLVGWRGYYGHCDVPGQLRDLEGWIRRRLRSAMWKQWQRPRRRVAELMRRGAGQELAHTTGYSSKGPWTMSRSPVVNAALPNAYFTRLGLPPLVMP